MNNKVKLGIKLHLSHIITFIKTRRLTDLERAELDAAERLLVNKNLTHRQLFDIFMLLASGACNIADMDSAAQDPEIEITVEDTKEDLREEFEEIKMEMATSNVELDDSDFLDLIAVIEEVLLNLHKGKYVPYFSSMHLGTRDLTQLIDQLIEESPEFSDKHKEENKKKKETKKKKTTKKKPEVKTKKDIDEFGNITFYSGDQVDNYEYVYEPENPDKNIANQVKEEKVEDNRLVPSKIVAELDKYAIGQDEVKKQLAVFVANHYNSIVENPDSFYKQSLLITGETGTGKTLLVKSLGKIVGKPVHTVDITEYSKAGYVGKSLTDLANEIGQAGYEEPPIIFIDEFDKLSGYGQTDGKGGSGANVMDDSVQNNLLKVLEGESKLGTNDSGRGGTYKVHYHTCCIILGGSFQKFIEDKKKNLAKKGTTSVGFEKKVKKVKDIEIQLTHNDIVKAGIKRELVGRIGMIVQTEPLTEKVWMEILTKPKGCVKDHFNRLFKDNGIKDSVTTKDLKAIIKQAKSADLGARGLWAIAGIYFADRLFH